MAAIAYYNEIDPFAAQWLRNLIDAGHIAPGVVDTRSIEEVTANDLKGFTQCHFFAGIGVWSYTLRSAGWPDDRPVWTGSCPCQPFSACGKRQGFDDPRHHWPSWAHLIKECHPDVIFGEQVASKDGLAWLDAVQADLENADYAFAGFDLCAAGFGAPHIRQRLFWVADADSEFMEASIECGQGGRIELADSGSLIGVDYAKCKRRNAGRNRDYSGYVRQQSGATSEDGWVADAMRTRLRTQPGKPNEKICIKGEEANHVSALRGDGTTGQVNGFWGSADWLFCRDGKWRPVKPGLSPLVDGVAGRVGQLRAYGNAIVAPVAEAFIAAYLDCAQ